ncbi:MAG: tetratricopeptide repeat protein [Pseudomonadales bacterium]|nr:tetratricopeptide repeat protein [Pseudomonadales bacterium]
MSIVLPRFILLALMGAVLIGCQSTQPNMGKQIKVDSDPAKPYLIRGGQAYLEKDWPAAIKSYEKALEVNTGSLPAMYKLGNIAYRQKKLPVARSYYEKVMKKDPRYSMAQYNLAVVNLALAEKHFKFYTATMKTDADITSVSDLLGHIYQFSTGRSSQSDDNSSLDRLAKSLRDK